MSFGVFKVFNQVILAKQGQRLLCNQNLIAHQILKAKYSKNSKFLEARRGYDPSYV